MGDAGVEGFAAGSCPGGPTPGSASIGAVSFASSELVMGPLGFSPAKTMARNASRTMRRASGALYPPLTMRVKQACLLAANCFLSFLFIWRVSWLPDAGGAGVPALFGRACVLAVGCDARVTWTVTPPPGKAVMEYEPHASFLRTRCAARTTDRIDAVLRCVPRGPSRSRREAPPLFSRELMRGRRPWPAPS